MKKVTKLNFVHEFNDKCKILFRHQNAAQLHNTKSENQLSESWEKQQQNQTEFTIN
jgi:hypothetical protein